MADNLTPTQRRKNMQSIRSQDTSGEINVRKRLFARGYRFRKNDKKYPGSPDIVLPKYRTVIFVNGCFWHGHQECKDFVLPKSNTEYWTKKIKKNIERDKSNYCELKKNGWKILVIWECELKPSVIEGTIEKLDSVLQSGLSPTQFDC